MSWFEGGIDIKLSRSERNCLKYITKDYPVYFNFPIDILSFCYRSMHWVKNSARFRFNDIYVMQHHDKWRFLQKLYSKVVVSKYREKEIFHLIYKACRGRWFECAVWWSNRIAGKTKKYLHLYGRIRNWNLSILSPVSCRSANSFMRHKRKIIES